MSEKKAASLSSSLLARKGGASAAGFAIPYMYARQAAPRILALRWREAIWPLSFAAFALATVLTVGWYGLGLGGGTEEETVAIRAAAEPEGGGVGRPGAPAAALAAPAVLAAPETTPGPKPSLSPPAITVLLPPPAEKMPDGAAGSPQAAGKSPSPRGAEAAKKAAGVEPAAGRSTARSVGTRSQAARLPVSY